MFSESKKLMLLKMLVSAILIACSIVTSGNGKHLSLIIAWLAYVVVVYQLVINVAKDLFKRKSVDEKMFIFISSLGAMIIGAHLDAVCVIIIYAIGKMVEDKAKEHAGRSLRTLESIRSNKVRMKDGAIVPVSDVQIGAVIEVYPGEHIALDGVVLQGDGKIDTSAITGDRNLITVDKGSEVLAGYLNTNTILTIKVIRPLNRTAAQRIIDLSKNSLEKKTRSERFVKKFAKAFLPAVVGLAVFIGLVPPIIDLITPIFGSLGFKYWIYKGLSVLSLSCTSVFVVTVPLTYISGISYARKKGILIRSAEVMEELRNAEIVAFDKAGTLTRSELLVTRIESCDDINKLKLLELVAIVESKSRHPMAEAIIKEAKKFNVHIVEGINYEETLGSGVECDSIYGHIKAGSGQFVDHPSGILAQIYVSLDGKFVGYIGIGDELKRNSKKTFESLRRLGVKKKIVLGCEKKSKVDAVAKRINGDQAYSNFKPEDKIHVIEDMRVSNPNMKIVYCGDGLYDIDALASADVGITLEAIGSDVAVNASDVIIMDDNIENVPLAMKICKKTHKTVKLNIVLTVLAKLAVLALIGLPMINFRMTCAVLVDVSVFTVALISSLRAGR